METSGTEELAVRCGGCGFIITNWANIFEGMQTSYICPKCGYEGYACKLAAKATRKRRYGEADRVYESLGIGGSFGNRNQYEARLVLGSPPAIEVSAGGKVVQKFATLQNFAAFYAKAGRGKLEHE